MQGTNKLELNDESLCELVEEALNRRFGIGHQIIVDEVCFNPKTETFDILFRAKASEADDV